MEGTTKREINKIKIRENKKNAAKSRPMRKTLNVTFTEIKAIFLETKIVQRHVADVIKWDVIKHNEKPE